MAKSKSSKNNLTRDQWLDRLKQGQKVQEPWMERAKRFKKYLEGAPKEPKSGGQVSVNSMFKDLKTSIPAVFAKNPDVLAQAATKTPVAKRMAQIARQVLPYYYKELGLKRTINRILVDVKTFGMGYLKLGFDFEMAQQEIDPEVWQELSEDKKQFLRDLPSNQGKEDGKKIVQEQITANDPWMLRWGPEDVVIDPEATSPDLSDARWIAFKKLMPRTDAEKMMKMTLSDEVNFRVPAGTDKKDRNKSDFHRLTLWEIHDKLRSERRLLTEEVDWEESVPLEDLDGFWCVALFFNEIPDCPYGDPDVRYYEGQLVELNDIRTAQMKHRRRHNTQTLFEEGSMKDTELSKATLNEDGSWIRVNPGKIGAIQPKTIPPLPSDLYATESRVKGDIFEIVGSSAERPAEGGVEKTATEASISESNRRSRSAERQDGVEELLQVATRKLWMVIRMKVDRTRIEEIMGEPVPEWENISSEEARKEIDIIIRTNSTLPRLERTLMIAQDLQLLTLLATYAPLVEQHGYKVNIVPLLNEVLELLNHKTTADELLQPAGANPFMIQQMQQLAALGGLQEGPGGPDMSATNGGSLKRGTPGGSPQSATPPAIASPAGMSERMGGMGVPLS